MRVCVCVCDGVEGGWRILLLRFFRELYHEKIIAVFSELKLLSGILSEIFNILSLDSEQKRDETGKFCLLEHNCTIMFFRNFYKVRDFCDLHTGRHSPSKSIHNEK